MDSIRLALVGAVLTLTLAGCGAASTFGPAFPDDSRTEVEAVAQEGEVGNPDLTELQGLSEYTALSSSAEDRILARYAHLDPRRLISSVLLKKAVLYYDANKAKLGNTEYLSVIDFSKRSTEARFYIIQVKTGAVAAIHVAHGKGTDPGHDGYADPERFSNVPGSLASSLGVYVTSSTYHGQHGLSLRLNGMSTTNSNARSRAIVLHGAPYVVEAKKIQGRSYGCPAVAMELRDDVIQRLKGGSVIFAGLSK